MNNNNYKDRNKLKFLLGGKWMEKCVHNIEYYT
jgi:hypothetical protein